MLMLTRTMIAAAILLGAAWFVVLGVGNSSSYQECIADGKLREGDQSIDKNLAHLFTSGIISRCAGEFLDRNNGAITAAATVVIAIFTTVLGLFTISLAKSTRIAADAANLSAKAAIAIDLPVIRAHAQIIDYGTSITQETKRHTVSINNLFFFKPRQKQGVSH
jgi:hypothetical protein